MFCWFCNKIVPKKLILWDYKNYRRWLRWWVTGQKSAGLGRGLLTLITANLFPKIRLTVRKVTLLVIGSCREKLRCNYNFLKINLLRSYQKWPWNCHLNRLPLPKTNNLRPIIEKPISVVKLRFSSQITWYRISSQTIMSSKRKWLRIWHNKKTKLIIILKFF